jgi:hypothetical protein
MAWRWFLLHNWSSSCKQKSMEPVSYPTTSNSSSFKCEKPWRPSYLQAQSWTALEGKVAETGLPLNWKMTALNYVSSLKALGGSMANNIHSRNINFSLVSLKILIRWLDHEVNTPHAFLLHNLQITHRLVNHVWTIYMCFLMWMLSLNMHKMLETTRIKLSICDYNFQL